MQQHAFEPGRDPRFCGRAVSVRRGAGWFEEDTTCGYPPETHPTEEELTDIATTNRAPVGWSWPQAEGELAPERLGIHPREDAEDEESAFQLPTAKEPPLFEERPRRNGKATDISDRWYPR